MWVSRFASEVLLATALVVLAAPGAAMADGDGSAPLSSFSHRMAQGRFFLDAGQAREALAEFEAAALLPDGQSRAEVHQLIARTRYELGEIGGAVEAAKTAAALAGRLEPKFAEFHEFLTSRFGKVLVIGANVEGASEPEPATPLLDPELKRAFVAAKANLVAREDGSSSIYLPVGSYRVGAHIVEVVAKGVSRMDLRPSVGSSGSGVYGERRKEERRGMKKPARRTPSKGKFSPPPPPSGAFLLVGGGSGYAQQGNAGAAARLLVGVELDALGGGLVLDASLQAGILRAERFQGEISAPPAGLVGGRFAMAGALPVGTRMRFGPLLAWSIGVAGAAPSLLPGQYCGPSAYLVQGPEVGLRVAGDARSRVRPVLAMYGFVTESTPVGATLPDDARPHLTFGGGFDVGVRVP